ncbi:MAG: hypothetical protein E7167_00280 [Firmicutes bacterium]|nr:hypothetical protein [Bacillota bacterium]
MSVLLDLFVSTYTNLHTFFFLNVLNHKNIYNIIFWGLVIDFIIARTYGLITFLLLFLFYIDLYIDNYYLRNLFNYFFVVVILGFNFSIFSLIIQILFIYLIKKTYY